MGGVHVVASGAPLGESELASVTGTTVTVGADAMSLGLDWRAGAPISGHAALTNVSVRSTDGTSVVVPTMEYSSLVASGAAPGNPLAGFGTTPQQALDLARMLLARAGFAWGGATGYALLGLLGVHRDLAGLGDGTPLLGASATVFDAPVDALREYLHGIVTGLNADGSSVLEGWSLWLAALLRGGLPAVAGARPPAGDRTPASGAGTHDDPWAVPVAGNVELLGWFEPSGPPASWATAAATELGGAATAFDLVDAVRRLAGFDPALAAAMTARDVGLTADNLATLAEFLTGSDGVVELVAQQPDPAVSPGWTHGTEVHAAHHLLPRDPDVIDQIRTQLTAWSPGAVLLVGPPFGSHTDWSDLLTAAGVAPASVPHVDFRQPGVEPEGVDVEALTAVADWYTADLADDGAADPARVVEQIRRVVQRIRTLHGGAASVAIVAHSTAGVPARLFVSTAPAGSVAGLVTVGSPLRGATLRPLVDPLVADAVHFVLTCLDVAGGSFADAQLQAAVDHLRGALDGFRPGPSGTPPTASPYPVGAFVRTTTDLALGGVPALAIGGRLTGDLVGLLAPALAQVAQAHAAAATDPTHLGLGWRTSLGLPDTNPDAVSAEAWLRVDAGRVRLGAAPAPEPSRPARSARAQVRLSRPAGWLAGSPSAYTGLGLPMVEARARWAELGLTITPDGAGGTTLTPYAQRRRRVGPRRACHGRPRLARPGLRAGCGLPGALGPTTDPRRPPRRGARRAGRPRTRGPGRERGRRPGERRRGVAAGRRQGLPGTAGPGGDGRRGRLGRSDRPGRRPVRRRPRWRPAPRARAPTPGGSRCRARRAASSWGRSACSSRPPSAGPASTRSCTSRRRSAGSRSRWTSPRAGCT